MLARLVILRDADATVSDDEGVLHLRPRDSGEEDSEATVKQAKLNDHTTEAEDDSTGAEDEAKADPFAMCYDKNGDPLEYA